MVNFATTSCSYGQKRQADIANKSPETATEQVATEHLKVQLSKLDVLSNILVKETDIKCWMLNRRLRSKSWLYCKKKKKKPDHIKVLRGQAPHVNQQVKCK